jgi:hypothetical protein
MKLQKLFISSLKVFAIIYILIYIFNKPKIDNDGNKEELERNYKTSSVYLTKDDIINKVEEKINNKSQIDNTNKIEEIKKERRIHYKPNNTNWEKLEKLIYFKRSNSYYFIDKQLGRLMFATHSVQNTFNVSIELTIYKNDDFILKYKMDTIKIEIETFREQHMRYYSIYFDFKLDSLGKERDDFINNSRDYTMEIFIKNNKNNQTTQSPIELKIKNLHKIENDPQIKYAMVCSKCLAFLDDSFESTLRWWLELHRQIGYSKLRFCNNSIPNTPAYNDLFYE